MINDKRLTYIYDYKAKQHIQSHVNANTGNKTTGGDVK